MVNDNNTQPDWTPRIIATFAMVLSLREGYRFSMEQTASRSLPSLWTSCGGFTADALRLFDNGDTAVLSGTFAPGDHVHLAIDFRGVGYSWKLTGALGAAKTDVTGSGSFTAVTESTSTKTTSGSTSTRSTTDTTLRVVRVPVRQGDLRQADVDRVDDVRHVPWRHRRIRPAGRGHGRRRRHGWRRRDHNQQDRQRAVVVAAEGRDRELHRLEQGAAIAARRSEQQRTCPECVRLPWLNSAI